MKTSELLRVAKPRLWDGRGRDRVLQFYGVCSAITMAGEQWHAPYPQAFAVCGEINERLGGLSVPEWLGDVGVPEKYLTNRNVQAYRHRWLDALIAEYEARGD